MDGASPRIAEKEVWGNAGARIVVGDSETNALVRADSVKDNQGSGITVGAVASPRVAENRV